MLIFDDYKYTAISKVVDFSFFVTVYSSPERTYHNLDHLEDMYKTHVATVNRSNQTALTVILFHDIVYDAKSSTNEEDSAALYNMLIDTEDTYNPFDGDIIWATKHLGNVRMKSDACPDNNFLRHICDLDLNGLGSSPEQFSLNTVNVRSEFKHLSDKDWYVGRKSFWKSLLARGYIYNNLYRLEYFKSREEQARQNINDELLFIDSMLNV